MASGMNTLEIMQALLPVAEVLEQLGVDYHLGGSVASSIHGEARPTQDIDLVADLRTSHVQRFVALLRLDYYLDDSSIRDAIRQRSSFNVIYLNTMMRSTSLFPNPALSIKMRSNTSTIFPWKQVVVSFRSPRQSL